MLTVDNFWEEYKLKVKLSGLKISHIAASLPKKKFNITDYASFFSAKDVKRIMESTGVETVHVAEDNLCSSDYFVATAEKLMQESGLKPNDFDGVILVFQTPDYIAPPTSTIIQDRLGLPKSSVAFDINYGCTGYIYGLYQAALLVSSGSCKRVLMFVGDTQIRSLHEEDRANRMVLGDGFAVTVIEQGDGEMTFNINTDGSGYKFLITEAGGCRLPKSEETAKPAVDANGNTYWREHTYMDGVAIMEFVLKRVPPLVEDSLAYVGWEKNSVGIFALHQANSMILNFLRRRLKVDKQRLPIALKDTGNVAGASIPMALAMSKNNFAVKDFEKVLFCGFGIGLSWATATANLSATKIYDTWEF